MPMSEQNHVWPGNVSGACSIVISSPVRHKMRSLEFFLTYQTYENLNALFNLRLLVVKKPVEILWRNNQGWEVFNDSLCHFFSTECQLFHWSTSSWKVSGSQHRTCSISKRFVLIYVNTGTSVLCITDQINWHHPSYTVVNCTCRCTALLFCCPS